ncbi:MAG: AraC family transcriptional regulator [Acidobacteriota bacterium]|nr:AraC family transcriptional regulator [Acidobacteriota bacterium]
MANIQPHRFKTISEFHQFRELPKPEHPLISAINLEVIKHLPANESSLVFDFYSIALKRNFNAKVKYGQREYDFDEGIMFFMSPGQVFRIEVERDTSLQQTGWMLLVHPDFLWNTPLAKTIKQYGYFSYSVNEALFLSEKEEATITGIMQNIEQEYRSNIDNFSQDVMVSQIELLLNYSNRFYNRQFITRKKASNDLLVKLEDLLTAYFDQQNDSQSGLPTVKYVADKLNVSPNYLSDMLRTLTGQNTQQHIHNKLIEKAKEALTTTSLSVGEIAYRLGFENPQSFNKLFKNKTNVSPLEFRNSFH